MIPNNQQALAMVQHVVQTRGPEAARAFVMRYAPNYPPQFVQQVLTAIPQHRYTGGLVAMNVGGNVPAPSVDEVANEMGMAPQMPVDAPMPPMGMEQPMPPQPMPGGASMAPEAPMRETFADKVAKAREQIKMAKTSVPTEPLGGEMHMMPDGTMMPGAVHTDGQGDGGVQFGEGAGGYTAQEVGPDIGPDTVDSMIPEGSFVMNAEGTEMFGPEIDAMEASAGPASYNTGSQRMIRAKLTPGERVIAPHVVAKYRDRLEAMNQGGLMARYQNEGGMTPYSVDDVDESEANPNDRGGWGAAAAAFVEEMGWPFTDHNLELMERLVKEAYADYFRLPSHEQEEWGHPDEMVRYYLQDHAHEWDFDTGTEYRTDGGFTGVVTDTLNSINPDVGVALGKDIVSAAYGKQGTGIDSLIAEQNELDESITQQLLTALQKANPHLS